MTEALNSGEIAEADGREFAGEKPVPKAVVATGICRAVLSGEWEPEKRLVEVELAERFNVSRTPVREALLELSGLGAVELRRNCGAVLCAFGPREVREIYGVRSILEVEATRLATGRIESDVLKRLREKFEALRVDGRADEGWILDKTLHGTIAEASGNRRLAGEISRYGDIVQAVRETVATQLGDIHASTIGEHLEIIDKLVESDTAGAAEAMRSHLEQAANSAIAAVEGIRKAKTSIS